MNDFNILPVIDRFIHQSQKDDPYAHRRARFMIMYAVIGGTLSIVMGVYKMLVTDLDANTLVLLGPIVFTSLIVVWMKQVGTLAIPTFIICLFIWLASFTSAWGTGGVYSMDLHPVFIIPVAAYIFRGRKEAFIWTGIILMTFVGLGIYDMVSDYNFHADIEKLTAEVYYMKRLMFMLNISALIVFYEYSMKRQTRELVAQTEENEVNKKVDVMRQKIAKDFHDEMGNKLAAITLNSNILTHTLGETDDQSKQILTKIEKNSKILYQSSRDFIWSIDSKSDELVEIFAYLKDFGEDFYGSLDIEFYTSSVPEDVPSISLPSYFGRHVILMFKEAMTNAAKYSHAKRVDFSIEVKPKKVSLCVKDNGEGFELDSVKLGKGLNNMKHRAEELAGELYIESRPNFGTSIKLELAV